MRNGYCVCSLSNCERTEVRACSSKDIRPGQYAWWYLSCFRNTRSKDKCVDIHRFPWDDARRQHWIEALDLKDVLVKDHHRVCSRHFPNADAKNDPQLTLLKRFASPKKHWTGRAKRAKKCEEMARKLSLSPPLVRPGITLDGWLQSTISSRSKKLSPPFFHCCKLRT